MKSFYLLFLIWFFSNGPAYAANSTCSTYLKGTLKLSLTEERAKVIKSNILKEKIWAFEGLVLQDISDYLNLNNVKHEFDKFEEEIIISVDGSSKLNRFARRIAKLSEAFQIQGHRIQPTQLIFNAKELKASKSRGAFTTRYLQTHEDHLAEVDPDFSEEAVLSNQIELSIAGIIQLAPTSTEFHEFIHWKSFLLRLQSRVDTLSFGDINIKDPETIHDVDSSVRFHFSLEEFHAQLIVLNKHARALALEQNEDLKEDIVYEIKSEIKTLVYHANALRPLLENYFEHSAFKSDGAFIEDPKDVLGITASMEELEVVRFNWVEQFALFYPQGGKIGLQALEYQMSNYTEAGWISVVLPLPKGYEDIQDFKDWLKPENKDAFRFISKALFYKMICLQKLVNYIENMNLQFEMLGHLPESPISYFYDLNRQYKDQLKNNM